MRGNHQLFPVFLILIAGLLFAGVSWAQEGTGGSSFQGSGNNDENKSRQPGVLLPESKATTGTPQKRRRPNSQAPNADRYGSDLKRSSLSDQPKPPASAPGSFGYGLAPNSNQGLTAKDIGPSMGLGTPSPQSTSTSYFDGLLSRSIKDVGKARKADRVKVQKDASPKSKD